MTRGDVCIADFNGDGRVDVVLSGLTGPLLMLGNGDGTLVRSDLDFGLLGNGTPADVVAADFDADGRPDFAVAVGDRIYIVTNATGR